VLTTPAGAEAIRDIFHFRRRPLRADHRTGGGRKDRAAATAGPATAAASLRVSVDKLDQLVNLVANW